MYVGTNEPIAASAYLAVISLQGVRNHFNEFLHPCIQMTEMDQAFPHTGVKPSVVVVFSKVCKLIDVGFNATYFWFFTSECGRRHPGPI